MARIRRFNRNAAEDRNTGFGENASNVGNRLVNRDGSPNTVKTGLPLLERISWYHTMIQMPLWKFMAIIFLAFFVVNLIFTCLYLIIGPTHLNGIQTGNYPRQVSQVFFFSIQTFTTVGYGHISPNGFAASAVAAVEAFCGLLSFALATGLLYGRFSRPDAYLKFSDNALISPYKEGVGLMFRMVPFKNNHLTEAEVKLSLAMFEEVDGKSVSRFYTLDTEISKINSLVLSWTLVHYITEDSPLYGFTMEDVIKSRAELIVFVKAFDETFSNTVIGRASYRYDEWVEGAKFIPMYNRSADAATTVLHLDKLSRFEKADVKLTAAPPAAVEHKQ
jgi:Inward rectifier potassium channel C-terminal domain/Ion channel